MNSIKKIALTFSVLLALLAGDAFAICGNKEVYIKLPSGWNGNIVYIQWEGSYKPVTGQKEGEWTKITIPTGLSNDNDDNKREIVFSDKATSYDAGGIHFVTKTKTGQHTNLPTENTDKYTCGDFGPEGTWIMEDPANEGKTVTSKNPPNARYFYFLPPKEDDWILGTPYLAMGNSTPVALEVDGDKCGWYKKVYFNTPIPDQDARVYLGKSGRDKIGIMGVDEDPMDWVNDMPVPFNLKTMFDNEFGEGNPGSLYFASQNGAAGWTRIDPNIVEKKRCQYEFAANIYFRGQTGSSFSQYPNGDAEGICRGYVQNTLDTSDPKQSKMVWKGKPSGCGSKSAAWQSEADFKAAFSGNSKCYDMPFERRPSGLWEFDAFYMCPDGKSMDYNSTATAGCGNSGSMGGFYLPSTFWNNNSGTYKGDRVSVADSTKWCYDRGWLGTGKGDLTGKTTKDAINAEMRRVCTREFRDGDLISDGEIKFTWGTGREGVKGLLCFESTPAKFIYEPGQEFFFRGDDDIWVFINNKLVVDLGGNHMPAPGYVNLDTLGLTEGGEYPINIFFCDRRAPGSNVRITTNLYFSQQSGILVNGDAKKDQAGICIKTDGGGGSCSANTGNAGPSEQCDNFNGKIAFYLISRNGTKYDLNAENSNCTVNGHEISCYGGVKVNTNTGKVEIRQDNVNNLAGTWYLYVTVPGDPALDDERVGTISAKSTTRMAWGNIIESETSKPLTNICKNPITAATGEWAPVCISAGGQTGNNFEAGLAADIGGYTFKLSTTLNHLGQKLRVSYDSLGTDLVDVGATFTIPGGAGGQPRPNSGSVPGVLVLWVTGDYLQEQDVDSYFINVSGRANDERVELKSVIPQLQWVKAPGSDVAIPPNQQKGSVWDATGDPVREGGIMKSVWVSQPIKFNLRAHRDGKTCKTCTYDLTLTANATGVTEENDRLVSASGLTIRNGEAALSIAGRKNVMHPDYAKIAIRGVSSKSEARWDSLQFQEPPIPVPENTMIYDLDGDGIGDKVVIAYNRGFHPDSLPNAIEVAWSKDTSATVTYTIGGRRQLSNGDSAYTFDMIPGNDDEKRAANREYWLKYFKGSPTSLAVRPNLKDIRDTIILQRGPDKNNPEPSVKFSKDVLTRSESGTIANWVSFAMGGTPFDIPLTQNISDSIPAIVVSARYLADENTKGCGTVSSNPCRDKLTLEFSEPVKIDSNANSASAEEIKNSFAYRFRDLGRNYWEVLKTADIPTDASMRYNVSKGMRPSEDGNDSIVSIWFQRWRGEGENKSGTPMPGDSVRFASLGKYAEFAKNILVDLKGNKPNPEEKGRQIEGRKPFTPDKLPIGEINPNNPNENLDQIKITLRDSLKVGDYDEKALFNQERPIELLPVPSDCDVNCIRRYYPGTVGMIFNPDVFNELADLEDDYGTIPDGNITIYPRAFIHTNLGSYVASRGFSVKCDDQIFPKNDRGQPSCRDSRSKFYIAWDMKDMKGRFVGAGAYVGIYDFSWDVYIPAINQTQKKESIERKVEMHGVKRVKK